MRKLPCVIVAMFICSLLCVGLAGDASPQDNGIELYKQQKFAEARLLFERNREATMKNLNSAYYYAQTLKALGKTQDAIAVCSDIVKRDPNSEPAKLAILAMASWSKDAPPLDADTGLLGFKFAILQGKPIRIYEVYPGTPALAVDLRKGDSVLQIDGVITDNLDKDKLYRLLRGQPDTTIELTIRRGDSEFVRSLKRMHSKDFAKAHPDLWKHYSSLP